MQLHRLFVFLLLLPLVALGSGWNLRICMQEVLGTTGCCVPEEGPSCCANEADAPEASVAEPAGQCGFCCIDIETPGEQPAPTQERLAEQLERSQAAALTVFVPASDPCVLPRTHEPPSLGSIQLRPSRLGRCAPLPLRI